MTKTIAVQHLIDLHHDLTREIVFAITIARDYSTHPCAAVYSYKWTDMMNHFLPHVRVCFSIKQTIACFNFNHSYCYMI